MSPDFSPGLADNFGIYKEEVQEHPLLNSEQVKGYSISIERARFLLDVEKSEGAKEKKLGSGEIVGRLISIINNGYTDLVTLATQMGVRSDNITVGQIFQRPEIIKFIDEDNGALRAVSIAGGILSSITKQGLLGEGVSLNDIMESETPIVVTTTQEESIRFHLEEIKLVGEEARNKLIEANLRMVLQISKKYLGRGVSQEDLIQEGSIGLTRAAWEFNHRLGYAFYTLASKWVAGYMSHAVWSAGDIKVPTDRRKALWTIVDAVHNNTNSDRPTPTIEELSKELGITRDRVFGLLNAFLNYRMTSLAKPIRTGGLSGDDMQYADILQDPDLGTADQAIRQATQDQLKQILQDAGILTKKQLNVVLYTLDMVDDQQPEMNDSDIARTLYVSRQAVQQLKAKAFARLKAELKKPDSKLTQHLLP